MCKILDDLTTKMVDVYRTFIVQNAKFRNYSKILQADSYREEMISISAGHTYLKNTLDSYLMEPIQRTMRYEMLVSAVHKEFEKTGLDSTHELAHQFLKTTVEKCKNAALEINELQNTAENHILSRNVECRTQQTIRRAKAPMALRKERVHRGEVRI